MNNVLTILRVMLTEAHRQDLIPVNPFDKVRSLTPDSDIRGVLTIDEAKKVLEPSRWQNPVFYAVNLTAAATGMRLGEILAVGTDTLHQDHIDVKYSYSVKSGQGRKHTKSKRPRIVPLPAFVRATIDSFLGWDGYVFSLSNGEKPVSGNRCGDALKEVLSELKIDHAGRSIVFHSWRHWHVTYLRSQGVSDTNVQQVVGHASAEMTDHYSHLALEHLKDVQDAQSRILA